jgi:hypothetical protein
MWSNIKSMIRHNLSILECQNENNIMLAPKTWSVHCFPFMVSSLNQRKDDGRTTRKTYHCYLLCTILNLIILWRRNFDSITTPYNNISSEMTKVFSCLDCELKIRNGTIDLENILFMDIMSRCYKTLSIICVQFAKCLIFVADRRLIEGMKKELYYPCF